ncbi:hypothetical protein DR999_PMT06480 [Platysternon megacephalum]|uniref:Uncharacterized protein n=1 Tax=Platysternon megacephalum TaxID=55544 RepID=A0A4D9EXM4_9SAUR|nr:hypothetical protein DR999_PMT06480 [Platysternon megacephalum]
MSIPGEQRGWLNGSMLMKTIGKKEKPNTPPSGTEMKRSLASATLCVQWGRRSGMQALCKKDWRKNGTFLLGRYASATLSGVICFIQGTTFCSREREEGGLMSFHSA